MLYKNIIFFLVCFSCHFVYARGKSSLIEAIVNESCIKHIGQDYRSLVNGSLEGEEEERFFGCLYEALELLATGKVRFKHHFHPDYLTKDEVRAIFRGFLEHNPAYSEEDAVHLADKILIIKRILIGGSVDRLRNEEIKQFFRLLTPNPNYDYSDYQVAYQIIRPYIPVFQKMFATGENITKKQRKDTLQALKSSLSVLRDAYIREGITYPIEDLSEYASYIAFMTNGHMNGESNFANQVAYFVEQLFRGLFYPRTVIQGEQDWIVAIDALYTSLDISLIYKTFFPAKSAIGTTFRMLEVLERILYLTQRSRRPFPLNHFDSMFGVLVSLVKQLSPSMGTNAILANINSESIPLLTRTLNCFVLGKKGQKNCSSKWSKAKGLSDDPNKPVVVLSFPDMNFSFYPDRINKTVHNRQTLFIEQKKLAILRQWVDHYKENIQQISSGQITDVAEKLHFSHWLHPMFGWEKDSGRIIFGRGGQSLENKSLFYQLLHYQIFQPLLLASYVPDGFFFSYTNDLSPMPEESSIDFDTWVQIVEDLSPALVSLQGKHGYQLYWRRYMIELFYFADFLLYSSNQDNRLDTREILDLTVHWLEGAKGSLFAYPVASTYCANNSLECLVERVLFDEKVGNVYPKMMQYFYSSDSVKRGYKTRIESILRSQLGQEEMDELSLAPVFVLLQSIELHRHFINADLSVDLNSGELESFAMRFADSLSMNPNLPLADSLQARSFLMYGFKTGHFPFLTEEDVNIDFTYFHRLNSRKNKPFFTITPTRFHFVLLDLYWFYQGF